VARGAYRTDEVFSTCSSRNFPRLTSTNRSALWQDGGSKKMGWPAQALSGPVRAHLPPRGSSWHFGFPLDLCHFEVVIPAVKIGALLVWSPNFTSYSSGMIRRTTLVLATFGSDFSLHSNMNGTPHLLLWTCCDSVPFVHVFLQKHNTSKYTYEVELVISLVCLVAG
jgi:hypothetical protein